MPQGIQKRKKWVRPFGNFQQCGVGLIRTSIIDNRNSEYTRLDITKSGMEPPPHRFYPRYSRDLARLVAVLENRAQTAIGRTEI